MERLLAIVALQTTDNFCRWFSLPHTNHLPLNYLSLSRASRDHRVRHRRMTILSFTCLTPVIYNSTTRALCNVNVVVESISNQYRAIPESLSRYRSCNWQVFLTQNSSNHDFSVPKTCIYQKFVVSLHRISKRTENSPDLRKIMYQENIDVGWSNL